MEQAATPGSPIRRRLRLLLEAPPSRSTRLERALVFVLPTLAALGPLAPIVGSLFAFRVVIVALFLVVLLWTRARHSHSALRVSVWTLLVVGAIVTGILSIFHGIDPYAASEIASCLFGVTLVSSILLARIDEGFLRSLLIGWVAAVTISGALALYEILGGWRASNYFINRDMTTLVTEPGLASTFGNPNDFAHFLLAAFLSLVASFSIVKSRPGTFCLIGYLLAIAFLLQRTESTLGLMILAVVLVGLVLARFPYATLVVVPAIAIVSFLALAGALGAGLTSSLFKEGQTGSVRLNLLANGFTFTLETGFLGLGPGGYERRTSERRWTDLDTGGILNPHSGVTEILSQYGLLVFVLTVAVFALMLRVGWRSYRDSDLKTGVRTAGVSLVLFSTLAPVMTLMASSSLEPSHSWMAFATMLTLALWLEQTYSRSTPDIPAIGDAMRP